MGREREGSKGWGNKGMGHQMGFQTLQLLSIVVLCFRIEKEEDEKRRERKKAKEVK